MLTPRQEDMSALFSDIFWCFCFHRKLRKAPRSFLTPISVTTTQTMTLIVHFCFSGQVQVGETRSHEVPSLFLENCKSVSFFRATRQRKCQFFSFDAILSPEDAISVFSGQMIWLDKLGHMMFIGSPKLAGLNEMMDKGIFFSDIPNYDVTREMILLNQQRLAEIEIRHAHSSFSIHGRSI